eukprot:g21835.t1
MEDAPGADALAKAKKFDLEAIIKQRVWDEAFDDVVRKAQLPPSQRAQTGEEEAVETLNFEKSRVGLGDIYAKQYEAEMLGHQTDAEKAEDKDRDRDGKPKNTDAPMDRRELRRSLEDRFQEKAELKELFARVMFKLDQLSNAHFTPRPPLLGAAAAHAAKVPSLKMEETIPLMVSDAQLQAPEEAKAPRRHAKEKLEGDHTELSPDEKAAVRRTRKVARKKTLERKVEGGEMSLKDRREREEKLEEKNQKAKAEKALDVFVSYSPSSAQGQRANDTPPTTRFHAGPRGVRVWHRMQRRMRSSCVRPPLETPRPRPHQLHYRLWLNAPLHPRAVRRWVPDVVTAPCAAVQRTSPAGGRVGLRRPETKIIRSSEDNGRRQREHCSVCPGAFLQWRDKEKFSAERSLAGSGPSGDALLGPDLLELFRGTARFAERSWASLLWRLVVPQITEMPYIMAWAEDSFWWSLGLVHALVGHLLAEATLLLRLLIIFLGPGSPSLRRQAILQEMSGFMSALLVVLTLTLHFLPRGAGVLRSAVTMILCWRCWEATVAPFWWWRARRMGMTAAHLLVVIALLNCSKNLRFDLLTSLLMMGPGAYMGCRIALELFVGERTSVLVQRWRFLESSVEQLAQLTRRQLRFAPNVIYVSSPEELGKEPGRQEIGLDFGGLFRDWLAQLALGLFDSSNGLVEHSCVDGTCYARLKPGADLKHLEAMGKVLGLALRDQQPLGVVPRRGSRIADAEAIADVEEEYDFWRRAQRTPVESELDHVDYQGTRSAEGLREHMERKALSSLVLDVSTELEYVWRGLRSVPNVSLPSLDREVKRGLEEEDATRAIEGQRTVSWFWDYVASLDCEQRSGLLQWITGYRRIPPGGFPSPVPYMTLHLANVGPERLPTAHTCGLQLDLPRSYVTAQMLAERLSHASAERQFHLV